jgi:hypothetical protein
MKTKNEARSTRREVRGAKYEAISCEVPTRLYLDLSDELRRSGDMRPPVQIVPLAIQAWLRTRREHPGGRGYQWKNLFLPDGTDLRMRYRTTFYYAKIQGDRLMYAGEALFPRAWTLAVTGAIRNAWRDIWIRRNVSECWTRASSGRTGADAPAAGDGERRRAARRCTD